MAFPFAAIAALGAGALGFAGQRDTNVSNAEEAERNRAFQDQQATRQMDFQERMSSSEIQRRVEDLKAAGLNPALATGQGGASAPSGSAGAGAQARFDSSAGAGLSSASSVGNFMQSAATQSASREEILARADLTRAQAERTRLLRDAELGELQVRTRGHGARASRDEMETIVSRESYKPRMYLMEAQRRQAEAGGFSAMQSARESEERTKMFGPQRRLLEFQLPMAENIAKQADTWFMRNVAPFLNSAKGLKDLVNPFK